MQGLPLRSPARAQVQIEGRAPKVSPGPWSCQHCQGRLLPEGDFLGFPKGLAVLVRGLVGLNARERSRPCRAARVEAVTKRNPKRLKYAGSVGGDKVRPRTDCPETLNTML
jgi:hypothetical protein